MTAQSTYTCAICCETFDLVRDETWSEEKAQAELEQNFPGYTPDNSDRICDDCYKVVMGTFAN